MKVLLTATTWTRRLHPGNLCRSLTWLQNLLRTDVLGDGLRASQIEAVQVCCPSGHKACLCTSPALLEQQAPTQDRSHTAGGANQSRKAYSNSRKGQGRGPSGNAQDRKDFTITRRQQPEQARTQVMQDQTQGQGQRQNQGQDKLWVRVLDSIGDVRRFSSQDMLSTLDVLETAVKGLPRQDPSGRYFCKEKIATLLASLEARMEQLDWPASAGFVFIRLRADPMMLPDYMKGKCTVSRAWRQHMLEQLRAGCSNGSRSGTSSSSVNYLPTDRVLRFVADMRMFQRTCYAELIPAALALLLQLVQQHRLPLPDLRRLLWSLAHMQHDVSQDMLQAIGSSVTFHLWCGQTPTAKDLSLIWWSFAKLHWLLPDMQPRLLAALLHTTIRQTSTFSSHDALVTLWGLATLSRRFPARLRGEHGYARQHGPSSLRHPRDQSASRQRQGEEAGTHMHPHHHQPQQQWLTSQQVAQQLLPQLWQHDQQGQAQAEQQLQAQLPSMAHTLSQALVSVIRQAGTQSLMGSQIGMLAHSLSLLSYPLPGLFAELGPVMMKELPIMAAPDVVNVMWGCETAKHHDPALLDSCCRRLLDIGVPRLSEDTGIPGMVKVLWCIAASPEAADSPGTSSPVVGPPRGTTDQERAPARVQLAVAVQQGLQHHMSQLNAQDISMCLAALGRLQRPQEDAFVRLLLQRATSLVGPYNSSSLPGRVSGTSHGPETRSAAPGSDSSSNQSPAAGCSPAGHAHPGAPLQPRLGSRKMLWPELDMPLGGHLWASLSPFDDANSQQQPRSRSRPPSLHEFTPYRRALLFCALPNLPQAGRELVHAWGQGLLTHAEGLAGLSPAQLVAVLGTCRRLELRGQPLWEHLLCELATRASDLVPAHAVHALSALSAANSVHLAPMAAATAARAAEAEGALGQAAGSFGAGSGGVVPATAACTPDSGSLAPATLQTKEESMCIQLERHTALKIVSRLQPSLAMLQPSELPELLCALARLEVGSSKEALLRTAVVEVRRLQHKLSDQHLLHVAWACSVSEHRAQWRWGLSLWHMLLERMVPFVRQPDTGLEDVLLAAWCACGHLASYVECDSASGGTALHEAGGSLSGKQVQELWQEVLQAAAGRALACIPSSDAAQLEAIAAAFQHGPGEVAGEVVREALRALRRQQQQEPTKQEQRQMEWQAQQQEGQGQEVWVRAAG